jgi:hypothetical protein
MKKEVRMKTVHTGNKWRPNHFFSPKLVWPSVLDLPCLCALTFKIIFENFISTNLIFLSIHYYILHNIFWFGRIFNFFGEFQHFWNKIISVELTKVPGYFFILSKSCENKNPANFVSWYPVSIKQCSTLLTFYHYGQIGDGKQGLESQTRDQRQGEFTNNFHVSDRLWNKHLASSHEGDW